MVVTGLVPLDLPGLLTRLTCCAVLIGLDPSIFLILCRSHMDRAWKARQFLPDARFFHLIDLKNIPKNLYISIC
jgi:hypothetical protein